LKRKPIKMIKENLHEIRQQIVQTALQVGRDPKTIKLIAVSKTFPSNVIVQALKAEQTLFAENKVQEGIKKREELENIDFKLHLIGHLQSNKVGKAVRYFDMIHSVDSLELAKHLNDACQKVNKTLPILLQINTSKESQKSGFDPDLSMLQELTDQIKMLPFISLEGLMTMGPMNFEEKVTRKCFELLYSLKEKLNQGGKNSFHELSMGMSNDYIWAIQEGSTYLRIGSLIFGHRDYSQVK
jgi:pyridoxal phosphate enzyme (YggS family)